MPRRPTTVPRRRSRGRLPDVRVRRWGAPLDGRPFAVLDVETTGLDPEVDRVIEMAVVTTDAQGRITDEWSTLLDPGRDAGATHVHGIADGDLVDAAAFVDRAPELADRLAGTILVAHNLAFDVAFLGSEEGRLGDDVAPLAGVDAGLCTLELSRRLLRRPAQGWSLGALCAEVGVPLLGPHRALVDARATAGLLGVLLAEVPGGRSRPLARRLTVRR